MNEESDDVEPDDAVSQVDRHEPAVRGPGDAPGVQPQLQRNDEPVPPAAAPRSEARSTLPTGDHAAQRQDQRIGDSHDRLRDRIAEVGPRELQDHAQQECEKTSDSNALMMKRMASIVSRRSVAPVQPPNCSAGSAERRAAAATARVTIPRRSPASKLSKAASSGSTLGSDLGTKLSRIAGPLMCHAARAVGGLGTERMRDLGGQSELTPCLLQELCQAEEVCRSAAGHSGDHVDQLPPAPARQ